MVKLIDTPTPPVDNEPKIKSYGSFRWIVINFSEVRKLTEKLSGNTITHFCPYDITDKARWVLLCEETLLRLQVNSS